MANVDRFTAANQFLSGRAVFYREQAEGYHQKVNALAVLRQQITEGKVAGDAEEVGRQHAAQYQEYAMADGFALRVEWAAGKFVAEASSVPEDWYARRVLRQVVSREIDQTLSADGLERDAHEAVAREGIAVVRRFSGRHAEKLEARLRKPAAIAS